MKTFLQLLVFAGFCQAQSGQVVVGFPTTYLRYNDNTNGNFVFADTMHCGSFTQAGNRYCMANDSAQNSNYQISVDHVSIYKLAPYSSTVPNNLGINRWSDASFQAAYTADVSSTSCKQDGGVNNAHCAPYGYGAWTVAGHTYLHIFLVSYGLPTTVFDTFLLRSDDIDSAPPHFCNSATLAANGNTCPANNATKAGDKPVWNNGVAGGVTFPYSSTTTPNPMAHLMMVLPANYQDDGVNCPVIPVSAGGDGTGQYVYWFAESADYRNLTGPYRVSCANLPRLQASDWEAWNGTAWTSTLSSAAVAAKASMGYGLWGTAGAVGTSMNLTYLPDLGRFVIMGQYCSIYCSQTYQPTLVMSQASSLTGGWTVDPASRFAPPVYQNGTNPRTRKINGAMSASTPGASEPVNMTVQYDSGLEPNTFPFTIRIGSEDLTVTAASGTAWTVTRGANGTTPSDHADHSEVKAPYRLVWGTGSFVQGTYAFSNGVATVDHISQGGQSDSTPNDQSKTHGVYGPYIQTLKFQRAAPSAGSQLLGNLSLRFSMGPQGASALPRRGLKMFWDFFQHNGAANFGACCNGSNTPSGLVFPQDLITGALCYSAHEAGYAGIAGWSQYGYRIFNNTQGFDRRCRTAGTDYFPLSGSNSRTVITIARTTDISTAPVIWATSSDYTPGRAMTQLLFGNNGEFATCYSGSCIVTQGGLVGNNTWFVIGSTYTQGAPNTAVSGTSLWLNGVLKCGNRGQACPTTINPNTAINTSPTQLISFGLYGDGRNGCNDAVNGCAYSQRFNGEIAGFAVWDRELSAQEMQQVCRTLQREYARPPRNLQLTCN